MCSIHPLTMYLLVAALCLATVSAERIRGSVEKVDFEAYQVEYSKQYSGAEFEHRRSVYERNVELINAHNAKYDAGEFSYYLGVNAFTDWTLEEHNARNGVPSTSQEWTGPVRNGDPLTAPDAIDWRQKGAVQAIKDQGQCGSCWAFGGVGGLEGQHAIHNGELPNASEQQLVSCDTVSKGCSGGWHYWAFDYVQKNAANGLDTQSSYPYTAKDDACDTAKTQDGKDVALTCTGHVKVAQNEGALKEAVGNVGPISVAVYAGFLGWQSYTGGIMDDPLCVLPPNHAVLAVGYGNEGGKDFWIIKNSWGTGWGESGYMRMVRGKNMCSVQKEPYYPNV